MVSRGMFKKFGKKDKEGARKEEKQLSNRTAWKHARPSDLTKDEKHKAIESLIFLLENRGSTTKCRGCESRNMQQIFILKEEASIPMVTTEPVLITSAIRSKKEIPRVLTQTEAPQGDERVMMNTRGDLAGMLLDIGPENTQRFRDRRRLQ